MKLEKTKISGRTVSALEVEKDTVFWDSELSGFGVRVYPTGSKYYVVQTRAGGKPGKRVTVGRHGVITADEARRRAALIISRIKAGEKPVAEPLDSVDPMDSRKAVTEDCPTIAELASEWLEKHVEPRCKPKTREMYRLLVEKHLVPAFGKMPALSVDRAMVAEFHHGMRKTPVMANQAVNALSRIWRLAEDDGQLPEGMNPCRLIVKYKKRKRERFLSEEEFHRLGKALAEAENRGIAIHAVAAIRLLLLTGCRKNEILTLKWNEVDLESGTLKLSDSKTGSRTVPLSPEAVEVLAGIPRMSGNPWVIPGKAEGKPMKNLWTSWRSICGRAGIEDMRIHDCRHSFASRALALGESLPAIGKLLGHSQVETTARYAHLAQDSVREAAERISDSIAAEVFRRYRPERNFRSGRAG
ncbi:MAG: tyrosine-type recombinase/integrase [Gammaproteobacteria bacterium]|nr:tyrosine-type recombinase/integrase [Gammaproteobacteria bacterium]